MQRLSIMRPINAGMCGILLAIAAGFATAPAIGLAAAQATGGATAGSSGEQPSQVVENVANNFLQDLNKNRAQYTNDPKALRAAVDRDVLPHFDVEYAARLVLGRYWRTATPQQQQRFISAFENSMLTNYGSALLAFRSDRLHVIPTKVSPDATNAFVRTQIHRDDGSNVTVIFALRNTPQGWKAWDVNIEGISYVKSFRDDFGAQIQAQGLDSVIQRLESGEKPANLPGGAGAGKS